MMSHEHVFAVQELVAIWQTDIFFAVSQNYHEHMQYLANTYHYDIVGEFAIPQPLARVAVVADRFHHQLAVVSKTKIGVYWIVVLYSLT